MRTYEEEMRKRLEDGNGPRMVNEDIAPGVKNIFAGKKTGNYSPKISSPKISASKVTQKTVPAVEMPAILKGKDLTPDYLQRSYDDAKAGDYAGAMYNEMLHNEKNGYLGLGYPSSHIFNYNDPYQGDLDRQRAAIENREPFSYDYREDDLYKSILAQKEKEADKAYNDGYAQLSRQFDGDIPVNMINKLITTRSEIVDQADSYIPQLYQLAREKYADEGDKLLRDYSITRDAAADDYSRWLSDRDFVVGGAENKYARDLAREQYDYQKGINDRDFEYKKGIDEQNLERVDKNNVVGLAEALYSTGMYGSFAEAYREASKYY